MPFQNRVGPHGTIFRSPARGTFMGNRGGALHNHNREIVRPFKTRRWIACLLEFRGRHRSVMSPGRYTELFFLDEAVALAAGHRPCAECRRQSFNAFKAAWARRPGAQSARAVLADEMDMELHRARLLSREKSRTYQAPLDSLPDGCFIELAETAWLVWDDALLLWTPERYTQKHRRPRELTVAVLTPRPIVECLAHGYTPEIHYSARAL